MNIYVGPRATRYWDMVYKKWLESQKEGSVLYSAAFL